MNMRSHLKDLASNPKLISGIYNYCDRWCERCDFTSRCLVYSTLEADGTTDELATHDLQSALFWQKLADVFEEARLMIMEWADGQSFDLSQVQTDLSNGDREQRHREAQYDETVLAAKSYALRTLNFFGPASTPSQYKFEVETVSDEIELGAAIDVIKHYQFFIPTKIFRAKLTAGFTVEGDEVQAQTETDELDCGAGGADGSAKIALIAIDRSQAAWQIVHNYLPQESPTIETFMVELELLKQTVEGTFPTARQFMRPGFDVFVSELCS